jgi:hypothetical protein
MFEHNELAVYSPSLRPDTNRLDPDKNPGVMPGLGHFGVCYRERRQRWLWYRSELAN